MPKPNPWLDEVKYYLRKKFYQQVDFESTCYSQTFSYETVRKCMYLIMRTSPDVYRYAAWLWATQRSRNDIAGGLNVDRDKAYQRNRDRDYNYPQGSGEDRSPP